MTEFGSILPVQYQMKFLFPSAYIAIFINWLDVDYMAQETLEQHPVIGKLKGWRNREIYEGIRAYDWTARMYE